MRLCLILLLFLAFAGSLHGQCGVRAVHRVVNHCPPAVVAPVVHEPIIAVPAVVPILVPAFSFQFIGPPSVAPLAPAPIQPPIAPAPIPGPSPLTPVPNPHADDWPVEEATVGSIGAFDHGLVSMLSNKCASCHTEPGSGGVNLFSAQGTLYPNVDLIRAYNAVHSGKMPKKGFMSHEEKLTLFNAASRQGR